MAWKNGGGETIEVAIAPEGATLDGFDWRVSMAHVAAAGPFSLFPGVDRSLAVLDGAGIVLTPAGRGAVPLDCETPPFAFPADLPVYATLRDGAIRDLNVMTRRGRFRHLLSRLWLTVPATVTRHGTVLLVLAGARGAEVRTGARNDVLGPGECAVLDDDDAMALDVTPDGAGAFYAIDLWRSI